MSEEPEPIMQVPKILSVPRVEIRKVKDLRKAATNIRTLYPSDTLEILENSIKALGLLELPKVTESGDVIAGWGRILACTNIGIEELPVIIMGNISEADQMIASLAENYAREAPLDEEIRGTLRTLQTKYGMSVREIARKTGMNKGVVSAILSLYDIPEIVQKEVAEAPLWTGDSLRKLIDAGEKQGLNREEIAEQAAELIKPNPITGKPLANKAILDELTGLGKQGRNIQEAIQQELARAKSSTYMTISFAIPEDVYNPVYKYSLKKKMTIQEVFLMAINEVMDKITTEIEA